MVPDGAESSNPANSARNHDLMGEGEGGCEPMPNVTEKEGVGPTNKLIVEMKGDNGEGEDGATGPGDISIEDEAVGKHMMPSFFLDSPHKIWRAFCNEQA